MRFLVALLLLCVPAYANNDSPNCTAKAIDDLPKGVQIVKSQTRANRHGQPPGWPGFWQVRVEIDTVLDGKSTTYKYLCDDTVSDVVAVKLLNPNN